MSPLLTKFLKFIKDNNDQGKPTNIKGIKDHFDYENHQFISKYLNKLEENQLIKSYFEDGYRISNITAKGVSFLIDLGCSYLPKDEQLWIKKLRREERLKPQLK